jgi:hypothetical protein
MEDQPSAKPLSPQDSTTQNDQDKHLSLKWDLNT